MTKKLKIINGLPTFKLFAHWLLPQTCFLCGDLSIKPLCENCIADLPYLTTVCKRCGRTIVSENLCWHCQLRPPLFTETKAIFPYRYPIDTLIHAAKYKDNLAILNLLGELMAQYLTIEKKPDILIPVPLHINKLRKRGYNQALELAKIITKYTQIPLSNTACIRYRDTLPQYTLSGEQRKDNVRGAFKIGRVTPQWRHIAIIDDVVTTGNTVHEVARVLLQQIHIQTLEVWCCARA